MNPIFIVILLFSILIYEKIYRPIICKKKIRQYINNIDGEIQTIEKLSPRDDIYIIYFTNQEKEKTHIIVEFNLFFKPIWKS